jgi:hypothetical protein
MDDDRNLGVTEARFALTLLICLLVAIGYVVLLRLGSSGDSTIEVRPDVVAQPAPNHEDEHSPKVLNVEGSELARRPGPVNTSDGSATSPR